jgi:hypothetical protein
MQGVKSKHYFNAGSMLLLLSLLVALGGYLFYGSMLRQLALLLLLGSLVALFVAMEKEIHTLFSQKWMAWVLLFVFILLYLFQRFELHRFDFSVGDPSDYFLAGVCSVTYGQDIGFFMPLSASITAWGYDIFGVAYAPFSYVLLYLSTLPLVYFLLQKWNIDKGLSLMLTLFFFSIPLNIWFQKSSYTEPLWQLLLLLFLATAYEIVQHKKLSYGQIVLLYLLMFLAPFLRGEGVLYYGLGSFLLLYHVWKHKEKKALLWLFGALVVLALSIHLTLQIRADYLLSMQFSRVIPDITASTLMGLIYAGVGGMGLLSFGVYVLKTKERRLSFATLIVPFSLIFKLLVAYVYSVKKEMPFMDLLFFNEYGLMVGNFGVVMSGLLVVSLLFLYYKALKEEIFSLLLVVVYTIFTLPFVMQSVRYEDVHAFFLYWNRYYLSVFMLIHFFAFTALLQSIFSYVQKRLNRRYALGFMGAVLLGVFFFSMNFKVYQITVNESHHKNADTFFTWAKEQLQKQPFTVVSDASIVYAQNKEHIGLNDLKYMVARTFSVYKMNVHGYQRVPTEAMNADLNFQTPLHSVAYVLALAKSKNPLAREGLKKVSSFYLPLLWREHRGLDVATRLLPHDDISHSPQKRIDLYATLYKVTQTKHVASVVHRATFQQFLYSGWKVINNGKAAFSSTGEGVFKVSRQHYPKHRALKLMLTCSVLSASQEAPKTLSFRLEDGTLLKEITLKTHHKQAIEVPLPSRKESQFNVQVSASSHGQIVISALKLGVEKR